MRGGVIDLSIWVCPVCGHALDDSEMTPTRGCFGNQRGQFHAKAARERFALAAAGGESRLYRREDVDG